MKPNPFDKQTFLDPPKFYRPFQIIHGMDRMTHLEEERPDIGEVGESESPDKITEVDYPALDGFLRKLVDLGTGGIVTNVGFQNYLTDARQWEILRYGIGKAIELGLNIWLYDEKGYPSGTAGGYVNRANPEYNALSLACYVTGVSCEQELVFPLPVSCKRFVWAGATPSLDDATREDLIDLTGVVDEWQVLRWKAPAGDESRICWQVIYLAERNSYEGTHASRNVSDFKQYINLLDEKAVKAFIRVTHEAYARELGPDLWSHIDAIFTDEPSFVTQYLPEIPERYVGKIPVVDAPVFNDRPMAVPWIQDLPERFEKAMGYSIIPYLYALFFSESDEAIRVRADFYQLITELYATSFFKQIQDWCLGHDIASSGHVLLEESIIDHPGYEGSVMKMLRTMDLPGIDMLNADPQEMLHGDSYMGASFMAIKQASSAAHLAGKERIHSESSDWVQRNAGPHASLEQRIGQANLQYALGVNVITSYYSWKEVGEEGWRIYNDVVGRLGLFLTGGQHRCDVAVLYPIRSAWAHFMPSLEPMMNWEERPVRSKWLKRIQAEYPEVVRQLLINQIDCDIVDEESIIQAGVSDGGLNISGESYRALVLPSVDCMSLDCANAINKFIEQGGFIVATGDLPIHAETSENSKILQNIFAGLLLEKRIVLLKSLEELVGAVRNKVGVDLQLSRPDPDIVYTHRFLYGRDLYFVVNNAPDATEIHVTLRIPGPYKLFWPRSGQVTGPINELRLNLPGYDGVLIVAGDDS